MLLLFEAFKKKYILNVIKLTFVHVLPVFSSHAWAYGNCKSQLGKDARNIFSQPSLSFTSGKSYKRRW